MMFDEKHPVVDEQPTRVNKRLSSTYRFRIAGLTCALLIFLAFDQYLTGSLQTTSRLTPFTGS